MRIRAWRLCLCLQQSGKEGEVARIVSQHDIACAETRRTLCQGMELLRKRQFSFVFGDRFPSAPSCCFMAPRTCTAYMSTSKTLTHVVAWRSPKGGTVLMQTSRFCWGPLAFKMKINMLPILLKMAWACSHHACGHGLCPQVPRPHTGQALHPGPAFEFLSTCWRLPHRS